MSAVFHKYDIFVEDLAKKVHNLNSDTLKVALSNTAQVVTSDVLNDITEISAGFGYTAGGAQVSLVSGVQTSGTYKLILNDAVITASGGSIGPFRYVVLYNSTPSSPLKPLIGWWDYADINPGSPNVILSDGESFTTDLDQTAGVLTIV